MSYANSTQGLRGFPTQELRGFPTQPLRGLRGFPTQELRGFPTQPLRGLGTFSPAQQAQITELSRQVQANLDRLVSTAREQTAQIVKTYKGSFGRAARFLLDELMPGKTVGVTPADEWAGHIVGYAENVRAILSRKTASGQVFFVAEPKEAARILELAKKDLSALVSELKTEVTGLTLKNTLSTIADNTIGVLTMMADVAAKAVLKSAFKFPVGAVALASVAVVAFVVWRKKNRLLGSK